MLAGADDVAEPEQSPDEQAAADVTAAAEVAAGRLAETEEAALRPGMGTRETTWADTAPTSARVNEKDFMVLRKGWSW
jgi:hypothetical protein